MLCKSLLLVPELPGPGDAYLFLIVLTSPGDFERFLRLQLDDADIELLVIQYDLRRMIGVITRLRDIGNALIQTLLDHRLRAEVACI